jgi:hypothetical protein
MKRPTAVTMISWLAIIGGALEAILSFNYLGFGQLAFSAGSVPLTFAPLVAAFAPYALFIGIIMLVLGVSSVVFGVGALALRSWAWMLGLITFSLNILFGIGYMLLLGVPGVTVASVVGVIVSVVILAYLYTETVREALGREHGVDTTHTTHVTPA